MREAIARMQASGNLRVMTSDAHIRIRKTWAQAAALSDEVAPAFYANLFRMDGSTKPLFVGNLDLQGRKLVQTLGFIVDHLDEPDTLMPAARELAIRHVSYGVTKDQYASVGAALIKTLRQFLGQEFSPEDAEAWADVYGALSDEMTKTAYAE